MNTALTYASREVRKMNQGIAVVTFDQPLFWKARNIIAHSENGELSNVVVRLGGFHLLMSFLGAIGNIMAGSGLQQLWMTVYAENSTKGMLGGHKYARAVRAHFLTQTALIFKILDESIISDDEKREMKDLLTTNVGSEDISIDEIENTPIAKKYTEKFAVTLADFVKRGKTAQLWIQYIEMVSLARSFIDAERSGNWEQHLTVIQQMLPYFHAGGHFPYAKSAHLYVQDMIELKEKMQSFPEEFQLFTEQQHFTGRRGNKFYTGTWTDMLIEQCLMRSIHVIGGIAHGRGSTPSVTSTWIQSLPATTEVCNSLEEFVGVQAESSEQHKDLRLSSIKLDDEHPNKFIQWLEDHPPFSEVDAIMSIATGVTGGLKTNCYDAYNIGMNGIQRIINNNFGTVSLTKEHKVKSLTSESLTVKIQGQKLVIDSNFLFQRMLQSKPTEQQLEHYFHYELSPYPQSLFDETKMRKSTLKFDIFDKMEAEYTIRQGEECFVVDGEWLLRTYVWNTPNSYKGIFLLYVEYLRNLFGDKIIVIFEDDGDISTDPATAEHFRLHPIPLSNEVIFEETMAATINGKKLLSNKQNKSRFVRMLMQNLSNAGIETLYRKPGSEATIVRNAIYTARSDGCACVVSDDISLLILLTAFAQNTDNLHFLKLGLHLNQKNECYSVAHQIEKYGDMSRYLPLIHCLTGTRTTSHPFKIGFKKVVNNIRTKLDRFQTFMDDFYSESATQEKIEIAGEKLHLALYNAPEKIKHLNSWRFISFQQRVSRSKNQVLLCTITPTNDAAKFHSFRAYHQLQSWLFDNKKDAILWGWCLNSNNSLEPIRMEKEAAPQELLTQISCSCKKNFNSNSCTCRKSGLKCSYACKNCFGSSCDNAARAEIPDCNDDIDDDEEIMLQREWDEIPEENDWAVDNTTDWATDFDNSSMSSSDVFVTQDDSTNSSW